MTLGCWGNVGDDNHLSEGTEQYRQATTRLLELAKQINCWQQRTTLDMGGTL